MAPWRKQGEVEVRYGWEMSGEEEKVSDVTPESEGSAGGAF